MKNPAILKNSSFLLVIFAFLIFQSCELFGDDDDSPQLPIATQTGKGTFACLINGKPFIVTNTNQQVAIYQGGILQIGGTIIKSNYDEGISFNLKNPLQINTSYSFDNNNYTAGYFLMKDNVVCTYGFSNTISGSIILTKIDRVNYIISGTFEFSTKKDGCEDIKITKGVFDLKYIP